MKLTLRDLFWLLLLVAGLTAWGLQHQRNAERSRRENMHFIWFSKERNLPPSQDALARRAANARLEELANAQLDAHFAAISKTGGERHRDYEPSLAEMCRRGMAHELKSHYDKLMSLHDRNQWRFPGNLELLTALRRAQAQPEPLRFELACSERDYFGNRLPPTTIKVQISNQDVERQPAFFVSGGDDRGGRRDRWRILLIDEVGNAVGDSNYTGMMGGGVYTDGPLQFGQADNRGAQLDLRKYVAPPKTGKYQLQLLYHNSRDIANDPDLTGLVVMKSQPIAVWVDNPASERRWVFGPELVPMLAIAVAGAGLAGAARVRGKRLARRDLVWAGLITCVVFSFWLDHCHQLQRIADLQPDAEAQWSIRLMPPN